MINYDLPADINRKSGERDIIKSGMSKVMKLCETIGKPVAAITAL